MEKFMRFEVNTIEVKGAGCLEVLEPVVFYKETKLKFRLCTEYEVNKDMGLKSLYGLQKIQKLIFSHRTINVQSKSIETLYEHNFKAELLYSIWVKTANVEEVKNDIELACRSSISGQLSDNDQLDLFN